MRTNGYAQNGEDLRVQSYFNGEKLSLLSIGENSGLVLSNALLLIEQEWEAVLVEPSPAPFAELSERHKDNDKVICLNFAVSDYNGQATFWDSGTHLNVGETGLLSTLNKEETKKWKSSTSFAEITVPVKTFDAILKESGRNKFQFISIDAEGNDLLILRQMNLKELDCKALCIEHNGSESALEEIVRLCSWYGLRNEILRNAENILITI